METSLQSSHTAFVLCAALLMNLLISTANADFSTVADVTGFSPATNGGGTSGTLVVGATDLGGLLGDGEQVLGGVIPLESPEAIIGQSVTAIGAVTLGDSASRWDVTGDLTVGDEGQGFLTISTSATVDVDGTTIVGLADTGFGQVEINGTNFPGARLRTIGPLTVGESGFGRIELTNRGTLFSEDVVLVGNLDGGDGTVVLTGPGSRWSVRSDLTIGNGTAGLTSAHGSVEISDDALLQTEGAVTINTSGNVTLLGGTLRTIPTTTTITNNGLILGDGFVDGAITISSSGELRNAAAQVFNGSTVINLRENLQVSGVVTNGGTIQSLGGAMEFESLVTNNFELIARDAEMHFRAGVINTGVISIGGNSTLHGSIANVGGSLFVLSDSESLVVGDLVFTASSILGLAVGEDAGTLDVTGSADLSGALLTLDYSAGVSPVIGDSYQIFQADGGISGFANTVVAGGGVLWDVAQIGTDTLIATFNGAITMPVGGDVNGDGIVDGLDIMIWENNFPIASGATKGLGDADGDGDVDAADFFKMLRDFGVLPVPPISAATAVPEPSTLVLALLTFVCCPRRRKHCRTPLRVV